MMSGNCVTIICLRIFNCIKAQEYIFSSSDTACVWLIVKTPV